MRCKQCNGIGKIFFRPTHNKNKFIECDLCNGTGDYVQHDLWEMLGLIIKDWRVNSNMTLRQCSKKYKIDFSNLSKMERGVIKPDMDLIKIILR